MQSPQEEIKEEVILLTGNPEDISLFQNKATQWPHQTRMLVALLLAIGMTQTVYMNISTFLPLYTEHRHPTITSAEIGLILSLF